MSTTRSQGSFVREFARAVTKRNKCKKSNPPKAILFEKRIRSARKPDQQEKSNACMGLAMSNDLEAEMDRTAMFAELSPSVDGFMLYNQMRTKTTNCQTMKSQDNKKIAKAVDPKSSKDAMDVIPSLVRTLDIPPCLDGNDGRLMVKKAIAYSGKDIEFETLNSLVHAERGAMITVSTEIALNDGNWIQYGCKGSKHIIYMTGVGRGLNPFTLKEEDYVIIRDSFLPDAREYNVSFENLKKVMDGIYKFDGVSYIPPGQQTSEKGNDLPETPRIHRKITPAAAQ